MNCSRCGQIVEENDALEWKQMQLCDDCYLRFVFLARKENSWRTLQEQHAKPNS